MLLAALLSVAFSLNAKDNGYWQQEVDYQMWIDVNASAHQYSGSQKLVYKNNSPDELTAVFYHLYFNAFQPESMMDVRSRTIEDPDSRVGDRIVHLTKSEEGWIRVKSLKMNGKPIQFKEVGTILEVQLEKAIPAGGKVTFEMTWDAQVPLQVRRSGWNNSEGIELSMAQWYPKLCEYDLEGWHSNPYIGREFHGVWGNFDVSISIDETYILGGTGVLKNADQIGHGYGSDKAKPQPVNGKLTWHWIAENVHDFVWAADPDYIHRIEKMENGPTFHFLYQDNAEFNENWDALPEYTLKAFKYLNEHFGEYPYPQYTVIQGGDGGMEYPMATLITGRRNLRSLVGVVIHEASHSWFHGVIATNESLYEWMDEGFTSFATSEVMAELFVDPTRIPHASAYQNYLRLARAGKDEALITHADHYNTNRAYGTSAYSKGEVLLTQLEYVIGKENRDAALLAYYNEWMFKHPTSRDFKRGMEKYSGIELDWYFQYFENTTLTIDYGIKTLIGNEKGTLLTLERKGRMPMPVDLLITLKDGQQIMYNIPLEMMRGEKPKEVENIEYILADDWPWTHPEYMLLLDFQTNEIEQIEIDPKKQSADIDRENNVVLIPSGTNFYLNNK